MLPPLSYYILLALADGDAHGWVLIKRIRELTQGSTDPSSGSLYLAMIRLSDQGLLEETAPPRGEDTDERRRFYTLTALGRKTLREESLRLARLVDYARSRRLLPSQGN